MSGLEFRSRGLNECRSRTICLASLKSRHAIKGQSNSPTGDVSVAETEQPRLGRAVWARPSTVTGSRFAPKCDGVAARLSPARNQMYQQVSIMHQKCKQFYPGVKRWVRNSSSNGRLNLPPRETFERSRCPIAVRDNRKKPIDPAAPRPMHAVALGRR